MPRILSADDIQIKSWDDGSSTIYWDGPTRAAIGGMSMRDGVRTLTIGMIEMPEDVVAEILNKYNALEGETGGA